MPSHLATQEAKDLVALMVAKVKQQRKDMERDDPTSSYILDGLSDDDLRLVILFLKSYDNAMIFLPEDEEPPE